MQLLRSRHGAYARSLWHSPVVPHERLNSGTRSVSKSGVRSVGTSTRPALVPASSPASDAAAAPSGVRRTQTLDRHASPALQVPFG